MAKQQARRGEPPLPAATVVIRGDLLDPEILAESAKRNFDVTASTGSSCSPRPRTYRGATSRPPGSLLCPGSPFTAGDLQATGLELWDTGVVPHHDVVHPDLAELVARMLGTAHRVVPNPHRGTSWRCPPTTPQRFACSPDRPDQRLPHDVPTMYHANGKQRGTAEGEADPSDHTESGLSPGRTLHSGRGLITRRS